VTAGSDDLFGLSAHHHLSIIEAIPTSLELTDIIVTSDICDLNNKHASMNDCVATLDRFKLQYSLVDETSFVQKSANVPLLLNVKYVSKCYILTVVVSE